MKVNAMLYLGAIKGVIKEAEKITEGRRFCMSETETLEQRGLMVISNIVNAGRDEYLNPVSLPTKRD